MLANERFCVRIIGYAGVILFKNFIIEYECLREMELTDRSTTQTVSRLYSNREQRLEPTGKH